MCLKSVNKYMSSSLFKDYCFEKDVDRILDEKVLSTISQALGTVLGRPPSQDGMNDKLRANVQKLKSYIDSLDDEKKKVKLNQAFATVVVKLKDNNPITMKNAGTAEDIAAKHIINTFDKGFYQLADLCVKNNVNYYLAN